MKRHSRATAFSRTDYNDYGMPPFACDDSKTERGFEPRQPRGDIMKLGPANAPRFVLG